MNWSRLTYHFLRNARVSPWMQLGLVIIILTIIAIIRWDPDGDIFAIGVYTCFVWMPVSAILSVWMKNYWWYLLHWFLAVISYMVIYFSVCLIQEMRNPFHFGITLLAQPILLFPMALKGSAVCKGCYCLIRYVIFK